MGTISNGESGLSVRNKLNDVIDKIEGTTDINNAINIDGALSTDTSLNIASSTTVDGILDEDNMASNSATKLATQQSIKAYVDAQVGTVDTLAEVLANGNTTGANNIIVTAGQSITVDTISETTAANGVVIDGVTLKDGGATVTADVSFGDNDKAVFGAGSDLQIYHASATNNSVIQETGSGNLLIYASNISMADAGGNEFILMTDTGTGGTVELKHTTSTKLATTATGIDVTGTVTADGLTVDGAAVISNSNFDTLYLRRPSVSSATLIMENSSNNGGSLQADNNGLRLYTRTASSFDQRINLSNNGSISFYEDTGTTAKFFWDASAESLGIGTTSPDRAIKIHKDNAYFWVADAAGGNVGFLGGSGQNDGLMRLYEGTGHTAKVEIHSNSDSYFNGGNVGIGTDSPNNLLTLNSNTSNTAMTIQSSDTGGAAVVFGDQTDFSRGRIIYNNSSDSMSFETNNLSEAMRIDSSGNVGIGTDLPSTELHLAAVNPRIYAKAATTGYPYALFSNDGGDFYIGRDASGGGAFGKAYANVIWGIGANATVFATNNTEAMRIDSSGNLLVGTDALTPGNGNTDTGHLLKNDGRFFASSASNSQFNRNSDGDILTFRESGVLVGSIGTTGGDLDIGTGDTGIQFNDAANQLLPYNTSTRTTVDNAIGLGGATRRFTDLYLSGGVYLGGTGAANKLDDYEEGTYETAITASGSGTVTLNAVYDELSYVKVGNIVHVQGFISISSVSSPTGYFKINLPFTSKSGVAYRASASLSLNGVSTNNVADFWGIVDDNTNHIQVYLGDSSSVQTDSAQTLQGGSDCRLQVTYQAA
jgi:mannose/fructose/N-acetylgalactosamine-specific phosphotransferase system component IIB